MTAPANKPAKRLPALAAAVRQAFCKPEPGVAEEPPSNDDIVRGRWRDILARYMAGDTLEDIGKELKPFPVSGAEIRRVFDEDAELRDRMARARKALSHYLFDGAVRSAAKAERSGEYGVAVSSYIKLAATLNKADYGQRVTVSGDPEAPIPHTHTGTLSLTPDEAYLAMLGGDK